MAMSDVLGRHAPRRKVLRATLPVLIAGGCLVLVAAELDGLDARMVTSGLAGISEAEWLAALLLTLISFAAVSQYDVLFHGWLETGISSARARLSGAAAIALAQTLGLGIFTGAMARWRALSDLPFLTALKVTNYVSFAFMAVLGLFCLPALWITGNAAPASLLAMGCGSAALALALALIQPIPLPSLTLISRLIALAAIDIFCAAMALWVLLPGQAGVDPVTLTAAFTLALGLALISGAPGGVGPFELFLLAALPHVPQPDLVAAILGFRLIYYALPACLGLLSLARPFRPTASATQPAPPLIRRAEAGLARLPSHKLHPLSRDGVVVAVAAQTFVAIGDPVSGTSFTKARIEALRATAARRTLSPALYKCSARSAAAARRHGWSVLAISEEAWLAPASFTLDGSRRRQLRRKLRQASQAGVRITMPEALPLDAMKAVARDWAARNGGERGFSMGRFDPAYVAGQRCFTAWRDGHLIAFATFHTADDEWCLDLMRSLPGVPDGTMHSLVHRALQEAKGEGVGSLSLAAMPLASPPPLLTRLSQRREAQGLRQFKTSFAPEMASLYLAAPGPVRLVFAGIDILLGIRFPARLETLRGLRRSIPERSA